MLQKHLILGMALNAKMRSTEIARSLNCSRGYVRCVLSLERKPRHIRYKTYGCSRTQRFVIHAAKNNVPPSFIAADLKISPTTVYQILRKARKTDPSIPRFRSGPTRPDQRYEARP